MTTTTRGSRSAGTGTAVPRRPRPGLVLAGAALVLVLGMLAGVWVGALPLPPGAVVVTLLDRLLAPLGGEVPGGLEGTEAAVLMELRLPRVLLASLVGAGLSVGGAAYQGVFRNPLVDPYLLGAAAGAGLGATLMIAVWGDVGRNWIVAPVPLVSFLFAMATVAVTYMVGASFGGLRSSTTLVLAGVAMVSLTTAIQTFVLQRN